MNGTRWLSAQSLTAFAGGASVGFLASQILPPLLSQAAASIENARGGDPLAALIDDHRRFTHLLEKMVNSRGRGRAYRLQLLLRLKRGLAAHAMAEEDVIYPLIHEEVKAEASADRLYAEHAAIKTQLYVLEQHIDDEPFWIARASELTSRLTEHASAEEEVEFPRLRSFLDEDAATRMARHVRREKAMVL